MELERVSRVFPETKHANAGEVDFGL